ncbi:MAG: hypothetical protein UV58_C0026G0008 [Candidatus Wolfebacteria bacterium GW2011_GWC1_43_10]|uniref:Uncharacterized protein n=1 Tax=Candidatus Wolfebacteria bacterium GW2011_GWC1_43_10 TaxID=1619011 RepID=A0A0G1F2V9_9BACT|nr:MAG: hypothetical protein UV58_C0026G0008 [Candidatus Wolfebacteria bacterium GW2011_GWC1_43_10]
MQSSHRFPFGVISGFLRGTRLGVSPKMSFILCLLSPPGFCVNEEMLNVYR